MIVNYCSVQRIIPNLKQCAVTFIFFFLAFIVLVLDSDCELFAFIFVYDPYFSALFYTVNFMGCALILSIIKAFNFLCSCISVVSV